VLNIVQGLDSLQIWWEGSVVLDMTPVTTADGSWEEVALQALAANNGSELRIGAYGGPALIGVEHVSVEAVPEPGSIVVLTRGMAAFLFRRRQS